MKVKCTRIFFVKPEGPPVAQTLQMGFRHCTPIQVNLNINIFLSQYYLAMLVVTLYSAMYLFSAYFHVFQNEHSTGNIPSPRSRFIIISFQFCIRNLTRRSLFDRPDILSIFYFR